MTPDALQTLMRRHGILHRELAVITGRTERAVYYWVHGKRPVPRSTELLLLALDEGRIDANWLISKIK